MVRIRRLSLQSIKSFQSPDILNFCNTSEVEKSAEICFFFNEKFVYFSLIILFKPPTHQGTYLKVRCECN